MPRFEIQWSMDGVAVIEADDADEAETILHDGLSGFDPSMFDEVDVQNSETMEVTEMEDEDK